VDNSNASQVSPRLGAPPDALLLTSPFSAVDRATREKLYARYIALRGPSGHDLWCWLTMNMKPRHSFWRTVWWWIDAGPHGGNGATGSVDVDRPSPACHGYHARPQPWSARGCGAMMRMA